MSGRSLLSVSSRRPRRVNNGYSFLAAKGKRRARRTVGGATVFGRARVVNKHKARRKAKHGGSLQDCTTVRAEIHVSLHWTAGAERVGAQAAQLREMGAAKKGVLIIAS